MSFNDKVKSALTLEEFKTEILKRVKNYPK